jgi:hypothetical protein
LSVGSVGSADRPPVRAAARLLSHRPRLLLALALMAAGAGLGACGASVAGKNPAGIWFYEPFIGGWSEDAVAQKHCAEFGRTAVRRGELLTGNEYTTPVLAYDCK